MDELIDRIATAFGTEDRPPNRVIVHNCDECHRVQCDFAGRKWTELSTEALEYHHDSIPLLSPEAFAYYLPAYLSYAARAPDSGVAEMLLYGLAPSKLGRRAACSYTTQQHRILVEVAERIAGDSEYYGEFLEEIRSYWA